MLRAAGLRAAGRHLVSVSAADPQPCKARPIRLPPHISGASAFRRIMRACLDHLAENQPAAIAGVDDEGVHQARVAIRRLRSALVLFEDYVGAAIALDFRDRLRDVARVLGEARDWDVFIAETIPAYSADRAGASVETMVLIAGRLRAEAHRRVRRTLTDPAHHDFLARIETWVESDGWRAGLGMESFRSLDGFCRALASPLLARTAKRVHKRGRAIGETPEHQTVEHQTPEQRHELRKAMKKLRYSAEFLATLYPPKRVRRYLETAEAMQDVLGKLNDSAAVVTLLDHLTLEHGRNTAEFDACRDWAEAGHSNDLHRLEKAWARFETAKPFWD